MPLGFAPLGRRPLSTLVDLPLVATVAAGVGAVILYTIEIIPASGSAVYVATEQYTTLYTDSRPNVPFNGTLVNAPSFRRSIKDGDGFGRMSSGFGEAHLGNASGEYDSLVTTGLDGARVLCKLGWRGISYDRFVTLFDGLVDTVDVTEDEVVIHFQDDNKRLEIPAQPSVYGGAGGADGDSNIAGQRKPLCLGYCPNVTAPLIDPVNLVYQVHDGQVASVAHVYDRGVELVVNATADYASYAALIAATITPGRYATCLAAGLIRLGAKPDGAVTVTAQGAVNNGLVAGSALGATLSDTASLVHYLITISGANIVVDTASILATKTAQGAAVGYFIGATDNTTLRQAIEALMDGIGGFAGFRADRTFNIGLFTLPTGAVVGSYTNKDWFNDLKRVPLPRVAAVPPRRFFAAYSRNFTVQSDIDATVDASTQTLRSKEYSTAVSTDTVTSAAIAAGHPTSTDSEVIPSWFVNAADAIAECNRRLTLYGGAQRSLYRIDIGEVAFALDVGTVMQITDSRFSLSGGESLTVVEIDNGFDTGEVSVEGFG